jgi:acyl-CoA:acyl-CoA alkyltransferase
MIEAYINEVSHYTPLDKLHIDEITSKIITSLPNFNSTIIKRLTGSEYRYHASKEEQVSDLAVKAVNLLNEKWNDADLLIFAAASSDLIEPATANIIQSKLGMKCNALDVKNACNSFVSAIHIANAFIKSEIYQKILIVNGEKISDVIRYNIADENQLLQSISGFTLGDAGVAAIISNKKGGAKIIYEKMMSWGGHWNLSTVRGGGSMHFRDPESYYFEGDSMSLKSAFEINGFPFCAEAFKELNVDSQSIELLITHQVTNKTTEYIAQYFDIKKEKTHQIFEECGNIAAATVMATYSNAISQRQLKSGDLILLIGLAAGINVSFQLLEWQ